MVLLRVLLFADTMIDWPWEAYVIIFVSFPSYLYLVVGLSQVMLNLESIVKYKNFKILETQAITKCRLKEKMAVNHKRLDMCYWALYTITAVLTISFIVAYALCISSECTFIQGSYLMPLELAIANIVVWVFLAISTFAFVSMLNKRFGSEQFHGPKCSLFGFLSVFSLSFFVRGTWDLVI